MSLSTLSINFSITKRNWRFSPPRLSINGQNISICLIKLFIANHFVVVWKFKYFPVHTLIGFYLRAPDPLYSTNRLALTQIWHTNKEEEARRNFYGFSSSLVVAFRIIYSHICELTGRKKYKRSEILAIKSLDLFLAPTIKQVRVLRKKGSTLSAANRLGVYIVALLIRLNYRHFSNEDD